jgi:hypothetical protein
LAACGIPSAGTIDHGAFGRCAIDADNQWIKEISMLRTVVAAAILAAVSLACVPASHAEDQPDPQEKLLIVNGNSGRVIYDDGRNDLFCVTRRVVVGYTYWGRSIVRRTMWCR